MNRRQFVGVLAALLPVTSAACARRRPGGLPDFVALIDRVGRSVVAVGDGRQTLGSGFAVGSRLVVTAAHLALAAGSTIDVSVGGVRQPARLLGTREEDDIALLEVGQDLPPLRLAASAPAVGEWIVVVGNPFGGGMTATAGIVSGAPGSITATPELARRLQINASVNPGNSGGPVCNQRGEVVGATTTLVAGGQGLAFATPAAAIRAFLTSLGK